MGNAAVAISQGLIHPHLAELDPLKKVFGEAREGIVSEAFEHLLKRCGSQHDLTFEPQFRFDAPSR